MIPADIAGLGDYERHAAGGIPEASWHHIQSGCGRGLSLAANRDAFDRIELLPRMLADLRAGSTAVELFGQHHASPILLAPIAYQRLAHPEGERAVVQAATALGVTTIVSTLASIPLEEIAAVALDAGRELARAVPPLWFQLYLQPERDRSAALIRRAEAAGYRAIVVTVDAAIKRSDFPLPVGIDAANLRDAPPVPHAAIVGGNILFGTPLIDQAPTWADIAWLREQTRMPLLIKGILAPDDAQRAIDHGLDGIIVSNHGGRVLDGAPPGLVALPAIARAVAGAVPLLVDGGVRSGADVAKALACGATAVLVGRPQMHALAVAGMAGVAHMIHLLRAEFELAMAQLGCATPADISSAHLFTRPYRHLR